MPHFRYFHRIEINKVKLIDPAAPASGFYYAVAAASRVTW